MGELYPPQRAVVIAIGNLLILLHMNQILDLEWDQKTSSVIPRFCGIKPHQIGQHSDLWSFAATLKGTKKQGANWLVEVVGIDTLRKNIQSIG